MSVNMLVVATLFACMLAAQSATVPVSDYTPVIWPQPASAVFGPELYLLNPEKLYIKLFPHTPALGKTIYRLKKGLVSSAAANQVDCSAAAAGAAAAGVPPVMLKLSVLTVTVADIITPPGLGTNESYTVQVNALGALVSAPSMAGAMWGLETFTQLAATCSDAVNYGQVVIRAVAIADAPRFPHRGLLLDTSRHYLPLSNIYDHVDAMVMNKLNVLHWHIVDDPSFPLVSSALPALSTLGAFSKAHTYTAKAVGKVVEYANDRGVRVVVEIDTPGHTAAWGKGYPELITECFDASGASTGRHGPLDPSQNATYIAVGKLLAEAAGLFSDAYLHLGGDEVDFTCWKSNPNVTAYMADHGLATPEELEVHYMERIVNQTAALNRTAVLWQEMFDDGLRPNSTTEPTIFQVWKMEDPAEQLGAAARFSSRGRMEATRKLLMRAAVDERNGPGYLQEVERITRAGYPVILSSPWYLDHVAYGEQWVDYYTVEPQGFAGGDGPQGELVLGGEACLWGEYVDSSNSITRAWPRAAAVAERLWSPADVTDVASARQRLQIHRCRMVARGIAAEPMGPGFCPGSWDY